MLQDTKKQLSGFQLDVLKDTRFYDTKKEVVAVLSAHLHDLQLALSECWKESDLHRHYPSPAPKIFKGENYRGYPYINLDFPRVFGTDTIFAFRTMAWWGNPFSFTLHLQGKAYAEKAGRLIKNLDRLNGKGYFICVNASPWEYHFGRDNYVPVEQRVPDLNPGDESAFIKLSRRLNLDDYLDIVTFGTETFRELMDCLE
jgi:hypothetical protein